jgi:hypothetical protein
MTLNPWKRIAELELEVKATRYDRDTYVLMHRDLHVDVGILNYEIRRIAQSLDGITNGTAIRIKRELDNIIKDDDISDTLMAAERLHEQGLPVDLDKH